MPSATVVGVDTLDADVDGELRALPASYYTDERIFAEERERLFFRTWQYA